MTHDRIYVTRPFLPPLNELIPYLEEIWTNHTLTNCGPFHQQLEEALCDYLGVKHISVFANATIALITSLKALGIGGEVITTPYSFVATAHSLAWNGLTPVFVDIESKTLNIDPERIKAAITPHTTAILAVHCYGHPCEVEAIEGIAKEYNLKVVYDAAHAFGVECHCGSLLQHGDLSVVSFHATKVFNTFEGGAVICPSLEVKQQIDQLKNFGFTDEVSVTATGINGKMSEFNAAFGLLQLNYINEAIRRRGEINRRYVEQLSGIRGIRLLDAVQATKPNHAYFPILVEEEYQQSRDTLYERLKNEEVYTRRYFYPLITDFPMYRDLPSAASSNLPVANRIASQVICLPIYPDLKDADVDRIVSVIQTGAVQR
jgi:dTDP-4-amino-4,6-dideoxygalactose transaminase